jgi:hypothetical protein
MTGNQALARLRATLSSRAKLVILLAVAIVVAAAASGHALTSGSGQGDHRYENCSVVVDAQTGNLAPADPGDIGPYGSGRDNAWNC